MLILPQLLRQPFLFTRLLEAAEELLHILASPAFDTNHLHPLSQGTPTHPTRRLAAPPVSTSAI
jgi:hypothetical protein